MVDPMDIGISEEDLPNDRSDEVVNAISGITESEPEDADRQQLVTVSNVRMPSSVLVSHAGENLLLDQESLKTTRIIIHNSSALDVLKNNSQSITFNSLNRSLSVPDKNNFNFDPSVYDEVLPVRCRNVRAELHKNKFGSGNRGRSILVNGEWLTPSEFEALGGRANSKDWKRSIRYGGRTLQFLVEQGILRPHATACTCGICCDDNTCGDGAADALSGPIRLFTPYKRRKKQRPKLKVSTDVPLPATDNIVSAPAEIHVDDMSQEAITPDPIAMVPLVSQSSGNTFCADSVIVSPETKPQAPKFIPTIVDFAEQKQWWQLEEMVKNTVRQIIQIQKHVEVVKDQCAATREAALQDLRTQLEEDKKQALNAARLEAQLALSRANYEAKVQKEAAVKEAIQRTRLEMQEKFNTSMAIEKQDPDKQCSNCGREASSECTGCHRVSYCGSFCQRKHWITHREECGDNVLAADCSELPDSDDPNS